MLNKGDSLVLKIGTSCLEIDGQNKIDEDVILHICRKVANLYQKGYRPKIVTSGAVFAGMEKRGLEEKPTDTIELQSLASIGMHELTNLYEHHLASHGLGASQILLTHDNFEENRKEETNVVHVINKTYELDAIPIINENDAVSNEELRESNQGQDHYFGDNDMLSYLVASHTQAAVDIMFNPQGGLYNDQSQLISEVYPEDFEEIYSMVRGRDKSKNGRGGLTTKIEAFRRCSQSGILGVLANSRYITDPNITITDLLTEKSLDRTLFYGEN